MSETTSAEAPATRTSPAYFYPIPLEHTGKLQYRIDRAGSVTLERFGEVLRGGVIEVKKEAYARGVIESGLFANAPADAPLGQPEELKSTRPAKVEPITVAELAKGISEFQANSMSAAQAVGAPTQVVAETFDPAVHTVDASSVDDALTSAEPSVDIKQSRQTKSTK